MKRTRKSDAGDKVGGGRPQGALTGGSSKMEVFNTFHPQKDVKASPQVNGKDADLSKRKCPPVTEAEFQHVQQD